MKQFNHHCPRCRENYLSTKPIRNAISRRDNKTAICSSCGTQEAFEDSKLIHHWLENPTNKPYWDVRSDTWQAQNLNQRWGGRPDTVELNQGVSR